MRKPPRCQVEGCLNELPPDRIYHKRYKICVHHATLPSMLMNGENVRFCQQCGRFQPLTDFEDDRKSCAKALDAHNEQRRRARQRARQLAGSQPRRSHAVRKRSHSDCSQETSGGDGGPFGDSVSLPLPLPPPPLRIGTAASAPAAMPAFPGFAPGVEMDPFDGIDIETLLREGADPSGPGGATPRAPGGPPPPQMCVPVPWPMSMAMSMPLPYAPAAPSPLGPMVALPNSMAAAQLAALPNSMAAAQLAALPNSMAAAQLAALQQQQAQQRMSAMMHPALARWAQAQNAFAAAAAAATSRQAPGASPFLAAGPAPFGPGLPSQLQKQHIVPRGSTDSASSLMPLTINDLLVD